MSFEQKFNRRALIALVILILSLPLVWHLNTKAMNAYFYEYMKDDPAAVRQGEVLIK